MRYLAQRVLSMLAMLLLSVLATTAMAVTDDAAAALATGKTAAAATPPDVPLARSSFEAAARAPDDRTAAEAEFLLGELDDAALQFGDAIAHYDASARRLPSNRYARRAISRASDLRAHAEGGFLPLVRLERVRRSADLANSAVAIDALVGDAAHFPPGKVRVEARMLAAEAYLGRLKREGDGRELLRLVAEDPAADVLTARQAAGDLVKSYTAADDLDAALEATHRYQRLLDASTERTILRRMRRRPLRALAIADIAVIAAFGLLGLAGRDRRRVMRAVARLAPVALLFAAFVTGIGGLLASTYERSSPLPFAALFLPSVGVFLAARAWSASASPRVVGRVVRGVVCFASIFAIAFLALDHMDPIYLQGFGL